MALLLTEDNYFMSTTGIVTFCWFVDGTDYRALHDDKMQFYFL